jgi:hypothetical protein
MANVAFWGLIAVVALGVSAIVMWAYRKGRGWLVFTVTSVVIVLEGLVLWDRSRKLHSAYRYEEPFLTTVLVVGVPVIAVAIAVSWAGSRRWRATGQIAIGMITGVATYVVAGMLGHALL